MPRYGKAMVRSEESAYLLINQKDGGGTEQNQHFWKNQIIFWLMTFSSGVITMTYAFAGTVVHL